MARKSAVLIPTFAAAVLIGGLGIAFMPQDIKDRSADFSKGTVRLGDDVVTVEIAETVAERQRWLTFRQDRLPLDTAMLIKYDMPDLYEIWMLNVEYNLDLIWFDQDGNAVYIKKNVEPCGNILDQVSCTYKPTSKALYIVAGTAGFADEHDVDIGSKLTLISV
ncbi:MAG TPA: DUF192 domain-containing protein [Nitrososphaera sp.]